MPPLALMATTFCAQRTSASYCFLLSRRRLGPTPSSSPSLPLSDSLRTAPVARLLVAERGVDATTMPLLPPPAPAPWATEGADGAAPTITARPPTPEAVGLAVGENPAFVRIVRDRGPHSEIVLGALVMRCAVDSEPSDGEASSPRRSRSGSGWTAEAEGLSKPRPSLVER